MIYQFLFQTIFAIHIHMKMSELEKIKILDNTLDDWLWVAGLMLFVFVFKRYLSKLLGSAVYTIFRRFSKENKVKTFNELVLEPAQWMLMLIIFSFAINLLHYPAKWDIDFNDIHLNQVLFDILKLMLGISFTWFVLRIIDFIGVLIAERATQTESKMDDMLVPFVKDSLKVIIVVVSLFAVLSNIFKVNIASLIAGLGIGGLAIALAAQESLKNLFASITIFLDKPFAIGDIVRVDDITGTVENIGFRSTRLRTFNKTYVTLPNKMMVETSVDNLSMRTYRYVDTTIILGYETGTESLKKIVEKISDFMLNTEFIENDFVVCFNEFKDNGYELSLVYNINQIEFRNFMEYKEKVNFQIDDIICRHGGVYAKATRIIEMKNKS